MQNFTTIANGPATFLEETEVVNGHFAQVTYSLGRWGWSYVSAEGLYLAQGKADSQEGARAAVLAWAGVPNALCVARGMHKPTAAHTRAECVR